jgi:CheY-like chemotaxis protein
MDQARQRTKILVIDDDSLMRELVGSIFEDKSYEILEAENAPDGLKRAAEHLPQLIIVDMNMVRMTGLEFIKAARVDPDVKHIPIVVLTGMSSSTLGYECLKAGAAAFFLKPLEIVPFQQKIEAILGHPVRTN